MCAESERDGSCVNGEQGRRHLSIGRASRNQLRVTSYTFFCAPLVHYLAAKPRVFACCQWISFIWRACKRFSVHCTSGPASTLNAFDFAINARPETEYNKQPTRSSQHKAFPSAKPLAVYHGSVCSCHSTTNNNYWAKLKIVLLCVL